MNCNILIFGLGRTATTALQLDLCKKLDLCCLDEPFRSDTIAEDLYSWVRDQKNSVMKLTTTNLCPPGSTNIDIVKLVDAGITHVVVTQRNNLVDCCISLFYAEQVAKQYHYASADQIKQISFEVDEIFVSNWLTEIDMYYHVIDQLCQNRIKYELFDYDLYVEQQPQHIVGQIIGISQQQRYIHAGIDYSNLCSNYQQVKTKIEDHVKRIRA